MFEAIIIINIAILPSRLHRAVNSVWALYSPKRIDLANQVIAPVSGSETPASRQDNAGEEI